MKLALIAAAATLLVATPVGAVTPVMAVETVTLDCAPSAGGADRAAIAALPMMSEAPPDAPSRICLTTISLPAGAPFRRLAVFQVVGSYWCGTAGCSTFIYGRDASGAWRDVSPQDTMTNAQEESVRIDRRRAFRGMPRLGIATGGGGARSSTAEWGWIPRLGRYSD